MSLKITQHHTADHNWLRDGILVESTRLATPVDIGGPYHLGDPAHIQEHNRTTVALQTLADAAGCYVVLPPVRKLGDTGHEADHLAWEQALAQIQVTEGWNDAEGGTVTEYMDSRGFRWRAHTFTQSGDLVVKRGLRAFRTLVIAGGGGGAGGGPYAGGGGGGGAGGFLANDQTNLTPGTYPVVVGAGGAGGEGARQGAHNGQAGRQGGNSSLAGIEAIGGGGGEAYQEGGSNGGSGSGSYTNRNNQQPGIPGQGNPGGPGEPGPNAGIGGGGGGAGSAGVVAGGGAGKASDIGGTEVTYASGGGCGDTAGPAPANTGNGGTGIRYGSPNYGGTGGSGIVVVAYQIAPYNEAEGGTVTEYTKDGKRFRVHTFTASDTFTVKVAAKPFRVAVVGGGGGGSPGGGDIRDGFGGGGSGGQGVEKTITLTAGAVPVTVGSGAAHIWPAPGSASRNGDPGAPSSFGDLITANGGRGGLRNTGGESGGLVSDISGQTVNYGPAGCSNCCHTNQNRHSEGVNGLGGGGGGQEQGQNTSETFGCQGGSGAVIVSYEVGTA